MEIVLGIDNLVFIAIITSKVEAKSQDLARKLGIFLALSLRVVLLFCISWLMSLSETLFTLFEHPFSGRDLILIFGGLFLIAKATLEIFDKFESDQHHKDTVAVPRASIASAMVQIIILDVVFSLDSVITAIGMVDNKAVMVAAMVVAMCVMLASAKGITGFIERHPSVKMLALSFLLLIGVMLLTEGMDQHVSKGYIYCAMGFSLFVEALNIKYRNVRRRSKA